MSTAANLSITMFSNSNGTVLHEKLIVTQLPKKFPTFMKPIEFYCVLKRPLLIPILSQVNPIHILISESFTLHAIRSVLQ